MLRMTLVPSAVCRMIRRRALYGSALRYRVRSIPAMIHIVGYRLWTWNRPVRWSKFSRPWRPADSRPSMIHRSAKRPVLACAVLMVHLHARSLEMAFVIEALFVPRRTSHNPTPPAIEADSGHVLVHHHAVINVGVGYSDVVDIAVIEEMTAVPISTGISHTGEAKPIINATVEADVRTPISGMPNVRTAAPTPVTGGPKQARVRSNHPCSGHPVVAGRAPSPIAGSPHVAIAGTWRLRVNRKRGRRNVYGNKNAGKG